MTTFSIMQGLFPDASQRPATPARKKASAFRPSGNPDMMRRLRVVADDDEEVTAPGCKLLDPAEREATGKLMIMSIWDALPALRKTVQAEVQRRKAPR